MVQTRVSCSLLFVLLATSRSLHVPRKLVAKAIASAIVTGSTLSTIVPFVPDHVYIATAAENAASSSSSSTKQKGTVKLVDSETISLFNKAISEESDGDFEAASRDYQQVIQVEPDFIIGWANLGNVLTAQGNLDQAILCYKKAISLYPPQDTLAVILLNKASIEMSTGRNGDAVKDLQAAELLAGPKPEIMSNKAVALTNDGRWVDALQIFEKIVSSAERNALPWWLRYSMALLETGRGVEAVAYYQRTLKSFPREPEIKAFGVALYTANGAPREAANFWKELPEADQKQYLEPGFVRDKLKWGPISLRSWDQFQRTYKPTF